MRIRINTKITAKYGMQMVCAVVIALMPILFSYKQIFSISPTYLALILCAPFALIRLGKRKITSVKNLGWITAYLLYCMASHGVGISDIMVTVLFLLYALSANNGVFNDGLIWKSVVVISCIATVGVLLQTLCYYLLGTKLFLCPTNLMEESVWMQYGVENSDQLLGSVLYRPASFFLEPSMFAQYVVLGVMYLRLSEAKDSKNFGIAAFLSVGIIASTSGMGIASLIVVWLLSYWTEIVENKKLLKGLAGILAFVIVFIIAYAVSDSLRESVLRVFGLGKKTSNYNAFSGRTGGVGFMFEFLRGKPELWYGTGEYIVRWHTWGFLGGIFRIIYEYGMIGAILFVFVFLCLGIKTKSWQRWIAFYVLALSLVTGISMQIIMFYYLLVCVISRDNYRNNPTKQIVAIQH